MRVERADQRHIGCIEPEDSVISLVEMAVPNHRRGQNQIAGLHLAAAAVDNGHRAFRACGETDRRAGVTVRTGALPRVEHREGSEESARGGRLRSEGRMRHDQGAPLDVIDGYFPDGTMEHRLDVAPAPDEWCVRRLRLHRGDALVAVPEWMQVFCLELRDGGAALLCHTCVRHLLFPPGGFSL